MLLTDDSLDVRLEPAPQPSRKRFARFGLRTLVVFVTLIAAGLGGYRWLVAPYVLQNDIRLAIQDCGGTCETAPAPAWLEAVFGKENVCVVKEVDLSRYSIPLYKMFDLTGFVPAQPGTMVSRADADQQLLRRLGSLTSIERLNVAGQDVTDDIVSTWDALTQLQELGLRETLVCDPGKWPEFPRLKELDLTLTLLRDDKVVSLAKYAPLQQLSLRSTAITDKGMASIAELPQLERLDICFTGVTPESMTTLQSMPHLDQLKATRSAGRGLSTVELFEMDRDETLHDGIEVRPNPQLDNAAFDHMPGDFAVVDRVRPKALPEAQLWLYPWNSLHLDELTSEHERITAVMALDPILRGDDLRHLSGLPNLQHLDLTSAVLRDENLAHLQSLPNVTTLILRDTPISDAGVAKLGSLLPRLEVLYLNNTPITDKTCQLLSQCSNLRELNLSGTLITDAGLEYIAGLPQIEELWLPAESICGPGLRHFLQRSRLPVIHLRTSYPGKWRLRRHSPPPTLTVEEVHHFVKLADAMAADTDSGAASSLLWDILTMKAKQTICGTLY